MTTSAINTEWQRITGKELSAQAELVSKAKVAVICVTIGCMEVYPMCAAGYTVDLSANGRIGTVLDVQVGNHTDGCMNADGYLTEYRYAACNDAATGTLHLFETAANACPVPFVEIPACATDVQCAVFQFRVLGF